MTAAELITYLQQLDPNTLVLIPGYEGDFNTANAPLPAQVIHQPDAAWYYGKYKIPQDFEAEEYENTPRIQACILGGSNST